MNIKCLSVRNPLSWLIVHGIKDVENRTWKTDYRGRLYIHSSGKQTFADIPEECLPKEIIKESNRVWEESQRLGRLLEKDEVDPLAFRVFKVSNDAQDILTKEKRPVFVPGHIIGHVELIDIVQDSESIFADEGEYHWIFANAEILPEPIPAKGKLGLYDFII